MSWFRVIISVAFQSIRKLKSDYRTWICATLVLIFIHSYTKGLTALCVYTGTKCSPWIFPFLYMQYYTKLLFFFPLVLIFSNAPFVDDNQLYVIARSGRIKWCIGQLIYILTVSALYFIFIIIFSVLLNIKCIEFSNDWGKILKTMASTDAGNQFSIGFYPDRKVIDLFTPEQAMWFTFLNSWLSGILLGLSSFLFNMAFKGSGPFAASFLLVLSAAAAKNLPVIKYSPVSWSTLNYIHIAKNDFFPEYSYVKSTYIMLITFLCIIILVAFRKFNVDNKK